MKVMYIKVFISGQKEQYFEITEDQWEIIQFLKKNNALKEGVEITEIDIIVLC